MATTRPDARTRVRQRIKRLLEERGKTQRALGQWLGHGDQWASNLIRGEFALSLDELDRVADFLRVPPSDIVRASSDPWELSPTEMRVVRALRMLPQEIADHFATMIDYTIGTTPDEADHIIVLRALTEKNQRTLQRWARSLVQQQALGLDEADPPDLPATIEPTRQLSGHIPRGRKPRE